jgi:uroporphyrinogen-III synthase
MLPLANRRILITRAKGQASALATQLEALGATPILIPTIEIAPPGSYCAMDAALASIRSFDWLIFTSANAVESFVDRARVLKLHPQAKRIAAIGSATAKAVTDAGMTVNLVPPQAVAESLAEALKPYAENASMLLVRAAAARDILPESLTEAGATVTIAEAYRNVIPTDSIDRLRSLFRALRTRQPDAVTFTSASTARNLVALLDSSTIELPPGIVLASIGPITSHAMRELGLVPTVEAATATIDALVDCLREYWAGK